MKIRQLIMIFCIVSLSGLFSSGYRLLSAGHAGRNGYGYEGYEKVKEPSGNYEKPEKDIVREVEHSDGLGKESGSKKQEPANLLIMGLDGEETRCDVIILLNFDPESGAVNILSVPRDTRVKVRGRIEKINALYGINKESLMIKAVEQLTDLDVKYYATINFQALREIVDILDGVEVTVPFDMNYDDPDQNLHIHLKKGRATLNGNQVEQVLRYRKGNKEGEGYEDGDIGRIKMQQEFIKEFFAQKVKMRYLLKIDDIFHVLNKNLTTNIKIEDIRSYSGSIRKISKNNIKAFTVPGSSNYIDKLWFFVADLKSTKKIVNENFKKGI